MYKILQFTIRRRGFTSSIETYRIGQHIIELPEGVKFVFCRRDSWPLPTRDKYY